jgi:predicted dehydrogenase
VSEFRLGVVGTGIVAALHLDAARATPGVRVAAVCDVHAEAARRSAAQAGATAYADHRDMLAREPLDGVGVTAPHALHAEMTVAAAAAGVHVLVEKPMATSVADCTAMIDACAAAGVVLAVGHVVRFDGTARRVEHELRAGPLGDVLAVDHRRTAHYRRGSRPDWFFDPVMAGGGIVMNVGGHGFDRIQWLAGPVATVSARVWRRDGHAVETDAMGVAELAGGIPAAFLFTSTGAYVDETTVVCEHGSVRWTADGAWRCDHDGTETPLTAAKGDAFAAQLADFVAACRFAKSPAVGGGYGRSIVAAVEAVYASARDGGRPRDLAGRPA